MNEYGVQVQFQALTMKLHRHEWSATHLPFHSSSKKSLQYSLNTLDRTFCQLVLKNFTYSNTTWLTVDLTQSKTFRIVDFKFPNTT